MYLFGGSDLETENQNFYALDLKTYEWRIVRSVGDTKPLTRDEHTALLYGNSMIIFGGFVQGKKCNEIWSYIFGDNKWIMLSPESPDIPEARAGHTSVLHKDQMYVFGGKDVDNNKLADLWVFDIPTKVWGEVKAYPPPVVSSFI